MRASSTRVEHLSSKGAVGEIDLSLTAKAVAVRDLEAASQNDEKDDGSSIKEQ